MSTLWNCLIAALAVTQARGHGFLAQPAARNAGTDCGHCLNGGTVAAVSVNDIFGAVDWSLNYPETAASAVRHGLCGDPAGDNQPFLAPDRIVETYTEGDSIDIKVTVTTHHHGWFEFKICDSDQLSQDCLNANVLQRDPEDPSISPIDTLHPERYYMIPKCHPDGMQQTMRYKLPQGLVCDHCILQWYWVTANTCHGGGYEGVDFPETFVNSAGVEGRFDDPGHCSAGDGGSPGWYPRLPLASSSCENNKGAYPEEFWNCADIQILAPGATASPTASGHAQEECAPVWDQCGGEGWTGPTCCKFGSVCQEHDRWYSQCVTTEDPQPTLPPSPTTLPPSPTTFPPTPLTFSPSPGPTTAPPSENPDGPCAKLWEKCGGKNWEGPTCCEPGAHCVYGNPWYSQCVVDEVSPTEAADPDPSACAAVWDQCGGKNWQGPTCCEAGTRCVYGNPWYSQCQP